MFAKRFEWMRITRTDYYKLQVIEHKWFAFFSFFKSSNRWISIVLDSFSLFHFSMLLQQSENNNFTQCQSFWWCTEDPHVHSPFTKLTIWIMFKASFNLFVVFYMEMFNSSTFIHTISALGTVFKCRNQKWQCQYLKNSFLSSNTTYYLPLT